MRFKILVEDTFPYADMKIVLSKIEKLGYNITLVDNGNIICDSEGVKNSQIADSGKLGGKS